MRTGLIISVTAISLLTVNIPLHIASQTQLVKHTDKTSDTSILKRLPVKDSGPVLLHGSAPDGSDALGARDVFVTKDYSNYYMTYDGESATGWSVNEAASQDGQTWKQLGRVLDHGPTNSADASSADYGTLYFDGKSWNMFYLADKTDSGAPYYVPSGPYTTMQATAAKPTGPWTKLPGQTLTTKSGTYYADTASPGSIIKQGAQYYMFFSGGTNVGGNIGLAKANGLDGHWQPQDKPTLPGSESIENPSLYYQPIDNTWFMFVNHVKRRSTAANYTDAIYVYWTHNLDYWSIDHKAIVLDKQNAHWSSAIVGLPSVIQIGNRLALYYDAKAANLSTSDPLSDHMDRDIGLAWINLPIDTSKPEK